jgi:hypothetical protein
MAVIILNANTAVVWMAAVANILLPTPAELNGGTRLEPVLRSDGLDITPKNNKIAADNLGSKYLLERMGMVGYDVKLGFHHDTLADIGWNLFPFKTSGFLGVRRGIAKATTFATGQGSGGPNGTLAVYGLEAGMADEANPPGNWDFDLELAMYTDPADRAVVA